MKLKDLEAYRAVVHSGSTRAAGELLGISQSAVSRRVAQLESDLGLNLFIREKSRMIPTRASRHLDQHAQDVLERLFFLTEAADDFSQGRGPRTTLRVAVPASMSRVVMPRIVRKFLKQHSTMRFEILHGPYDMIEQMLQHKQAEIGFLRLPTAETGWAISSVLSAGSVCVMPKGHRLAKNEVVQLFDLRQEELILLGWRRAPRRDLDLAFTMAGIRPNIRIETHSVTSACGFVAQGLGVSIVNALLVQECMDLPVEIRPFRPDIIHQFAFAHATKPELHEPGALFVSFATDHLQEMLENTA